MSKLGDAIRKSQRVESAPMGFGAARPAAKASMLVGFIGAPADAEAARGAGAEIIMVDARPTGMITRFLGGANDVQPEAMQLNTGAGELPAGVMASPDAEGVKLLKAAGLDFLVFEADHTPASALLDEDVGYVLIVPANPEELFLRSLEPLNLEALLLQEVPQPLTVAKQVDLARTAMLARKPMLARVSASISGDDLQCLRAAGVVALLVGSVDEVSKVKEAVAALPVRKTKRDEGRIVSLPRSQAAPEPEHDDDDDDE